MPFTLDLHIHSHYSRATSKHMDADHVHVWGQLKGIEVIGTGDFTHPAWFAELTEKLEPAEPGLFKLKKEYADNVAHLIPETCKNEMRYMLTVEISNIYSKNGKVRKLHHVVCAPSFEIAAKINEKLSKIGNIKADGRPILGLDSKELLKIVLDTSEECMFIPAHIWTPHFGLLGSKSGFDSITECFEELTPYITALETGLSADTPMSYRLSQLDQFTFVSNSDAHSPQKLGREANRLETIRDYPHIKEAVKTGDPKKFIETVEFYPEEGKYHYDGHASCNINFHPSETKKHNGICPVCKKPLIIGVLSRVDSLADRKEKESRKNTIPHRYLIPLQAIIADVIGVREASVKVEAQYFNMINNLGNEFDILLDIPLSTIAKKTNEKFAEAIHRVRTGKVSIIPGFDGEYGKIQVFPPEEQKNFTGQVSMF